MIPHWVFTHGLEAIVLLIWEHMLGKIKKLRVGSTLELIGLIGALAWFLVRFGFKRKTKAQARFFRFKINGHEVSKMQTQDNTPVVVSVVPVDAIGNPAPLASGVTLAFSVDNTAIGNVAPNAADSSGLS